MTNKELSEALDEKATYLHSQYEKLTTKQRRVLQIIHRLQLLIVENQILTATQKIEAYLALNETLITEVRNRRKLDNTRLAIAFVCYHMKPISSFDFIAESLGIGKTKAWNIYSNYYKKFSNE